MLPNATNTLRTGNYESPKTKRRSPDRRKTGRNAVIVGSLLETFGDPFEALSAAIVINAVQDLRKGIQTQSVHRFFLSDWFTVIAQELELDPDRFYRTLRASRQNEQKKEIKGISGTPIQGKRRCENSGAQSSRP